MIDPAPTERQRAQLAAEGYFILDPRFEPRTLDVVRGELERLWQTRARAAAARGGDRSVIDWTRLRPELPRLHRESAALAEFVRHPAFVALARALIGGDADVLWNQAHVKAPGGDERTRIPWHQDGHYVQLDRPVSYSCWVALTAATVDNGALFGARPAPGRPIFAHRWDSDLEYFRCDVDEADAFPLPLDAGQVIVFDTRWAHSSRPNFSAAPRLAYSISFTGAGARLIKTGEAFGDQLPLLRDGAAIDEVMADRARARGVLDELDARMPARRDATARAFERYAAAASADPRGAEAARLLSALLAIAPDDELVNGDLLRARVNVEQIVREAESLADRGDRAGARLLLGRALELEPGHLAARRAMEKLGA
jgi:ectoine hydroxylase-related dioxygenase (phytanoyl-CoA dioxygenase family)